MSSSDSLALRAVAGKFCEIFAAESEFQAFPARPLALDARSHEVVDLLPDGALWEPDPDRRLSEIYLEVLATAVLRQSPLSAEQERSLADAEAVLYTDDCRPSDAVTAYAKHRDDYLAAAWELNNRRSEAEYSADPDVFAVWEVDRPQLEQALDAAWDSWNRLGYRESVEAARRVESTIACIAPQRLWRRAAELVERCPPTFGTAPVAADPEEPWPRITLQGASLRRFAAMSPADLAARLGPGAGAELQSISFEYRHVAVERPWFLPAVLHSTGWMFPDSSRQLGTENTSSAGECPAYVSGLVLARNLEVKGASADPLGSRWPHWPGPDLGADTAVVAVHCTALGAVPSPVVAQR